MDTNSRIDALRQRLQAAGQQSILLANPADIFYYSGFLGEESWLLVTENNVYLLTDGRYTAQAAQECPQIPVLCQGGQNGTWIQLLAAVCEQENLECLAFDGGFFNYRQYAALHQALAAALKVRLTDSEALSGEGRLVKEEGELRELKAVAALGDQVLLAVEPFFRVGVTEKELTRQIDDAFARLGADGLSFPTIVAAGINGAKPHAKPSQYRLAEGDLVTMDFGGRLQGYCGDMTRTIAIGRADQRAKELYQVVLEAQQSAVANIKPGMTGAEADALAREVITQAGYGQYFTHSLGHGVGIEIHEQPNLSPSSQQVLQPGHVVTVEPGVYLPGWGGLRIEDTVVVTDTGVERLTLSDKELKIYG